MNNASIYVEVNLPRMSGWYDLEEVTEYDSIPDFIIGKHGLEPTDTLSRSLKSEDVGVTDVEDADGLLKVFHDGWESLDLTGYLECVAECDATDIDYGAAAAFISWCGDWDAERCQDSWCGTWDSMRDFAEETFTACYEIPEYLENYIDWDQVARDFEMDHYRTDTGHIFRNC